MHFVQKYDNLVNNLSIISNLNSNKNYVKIIFWLFLNNLINFFLTKFYTMIVSYTLIGIKIMALTNSMLMFEGYFSVKYLNISTPYVNIYIE